MDYSTIQQHQPLRVPSSFDKQGRALIVQLDEIFDDIYKRFGRLKVSDLGSNLQELVLIKNEDGKFVSLTATIDKIDAQIADCYGVQSGIDIIPEGIEVSGGKYVKIKAGDSTAVLLDDNGIDMQTAGKAFIHAKDASASAIIFGTDMENANFAVDINGDTISRTLTTEALTLAGCEMPGIIVSESQPSGRNVLWVKPTSNAMKQWGYYPTSRVINTQGGTLTYYRDYTIPYSADDYLAGDLYYGIRARLYVYHNSQMAGIPEGRLKARLKNGNSWIELGQTAHKTFYSNGYATLDVNLSALNDNVMNVSGGSFTIRIETDIYWGNCRLADENIIFRARANSASGAAPCALYYLT